MQFSTRRAGGILDLERMSADADQRRIKRKGKDSSAVNIKHAAIAMPAAG